MPGCVQTRHFCRAWQRWARACWCVPHSPYHRRPHLTLSPRIPNKTPPSGRMKKAPANTPNASIMLASGSLGGKKSSPNSGAKALQARALHQRHPPMSAGPLRRPANTDGQPLPQHRAAVACSTQRLGRALTRRRRSQTTPAQTRGWRPTAQCLSRDKRVRDIPQTQQCKGPAPRTRSQHGPPLGGTQWHQAPGSHQQHSYDVGRLLDYSPRVQVHRPACPYAPRLPSPQASQASRPASAVPALPPARPSRVCDMVPQQHAPPRAPIAVLVARGKV